MPSLARTDTDIWTSPRAPPPPPPRAAPPPPPPPPRRAAPSPPPPPPPRHHNSTAAIVSAPKHSVSNPPPPPSSSSISDPSPPPSAPEVQLILWLKVLRRRQNEVRRLAASSRKSRSSHNLLRLFVEDIVDDFNNSRYHQPTQDEDEGVAGDGQQERNTIDLATGNYSSYLITQTKHQQTESHGTTTTPATSITETTVAEVGYHFLALFYRSVDDRLPYVMRKHGLDSLRRIFRKLELRLKECEDNNDKNEKEGERAGEKRKHGVTEGSGETNTNSTVESSKKGSESSMKKRKTVEQSTLGGNHLEPLNPPNIDSNNMREEKDTTPEPAKGGLITAQKQHHENVLSPVQGEKSSMTTDFSSKDSLLESSSDNMQFNSKKCANKNNKVNTDMDPLKRTSRWGGFVSAQQQNKSSDMSTSQMEQISREHATSESGTAPPFQQGNTDENVTHCQRITRTENGLATSVMQQLVVGDQQKGAADSILLSKQGVAGANIGEHGKPHLDPCTEAVSVTVQVVDMGAASKNDTIGDRYHRDGTLNKVSQLPAITTIVTMPPRKQNETLQEHQQLASDIISSTTQRDSVGENMSSGATREIQPHRNLFEISSTHTTSIREMSNSVHTTNAQQSNGINIRQATPPQSEEINNDETALPTSNISQETSLHERKAPSLSEVIDLTDDLDDDSPPYNSLQLQDPSPATVPIKQDFDNASARQLDSPPAPPVPSPILRNPPPLPLPDPTPFSDVRPIVFSADYPISSKSLSRRPKCTVMFNAGFQLDGSGSCLDDEHCIAVSERLKTWDPYWKIVQELGRRDVSAGDKWRRMTKVGTRTVSCMHCDAQGNLLQCASVTVDLPNEIAFSDSSVRNATGKSIPIRQMAWGVKWGKTAHPDKGSKLQTGDRRLLVRTLPLQRSAKDVKTRADCHMWPKGTFLEMKRGHFEQVLSSNIVQRSQQSHAPSEWKGMSEPLDMTVFVQNTDLHFELRLGAYETIEKSAASDGVMLGSYAVHTAICEYVTPDDLYDQLMGNTTESESDVIIPTTSVKAATKMAKEVSMGQTVSIIDSDDEDMKDKITADKERDPGKSLTFSLLCSITKTAIQTPVRGRNCGHLQCFDLRNFLHANASVSGGRWRCAVCEDFVSVRDLVRCGLFQSMIDSVGEKISASRDRVIFHSDGTWRLLEPKIRSTASKKSDDKDAIIELV